VEHQPVAGLHLSCLAGSETNIIKCSALFWAIPWAGAGAAVVCTTRSRSSIVVCVCAGGSVFVRKWDAVGRVEPMPQMLQVMMSYLISPSFIFHLDSFIIIIMELFLMSHM
jgi:hypothetical protein